MSAFKRDGAASARSRGPARSTRSTRSPWPPPRSVAGVTLDLAVSALAAAAIFGVMVLWADGGLVDFMIGVLEPVTKHDYRLGFALGVACGGLSGAATVPVARFLRLHPTVTQIAAGILLWTVVSIPCLALMPPVSRSRAVRPEPSAGSGRWPVTCSARRTAR